MRSIVKMLGLAFFATLAFSAIGALGAGSASALLFLTLNVGLELVLVLNLSSSTLPAVLEQANGNIVQCLAVLGHGSVANLSDLIEKFLFTFHGCKSAQFGECNSAGEPKGLITTLDLHALLITTLDGHYGVVVLAEKGNLAEFTCEGLSGITVQVRGSVVGRTPATGNAPAHQEEYKVEFKAGAKVGEAGEPTYWTLQGTRPAKLESNADLLGTFEEASESAVGDIKFEKKVGLCHN